MEIFPEARRALTEFGGLKFGNQNDHAVLDPSSGDEVADRIRECERKVGRRLYPIGYAEHQDREFYLIDERGIVYMLSGDTLQPYASSLERAIVHIARRSIRRREWDEDLRSVGLAGKSWELDESPSDD